MGILLGELTIERLMRKCEAEGCAHHYDHNQNKQHKRYLHLKQLAPLCSQKLNFLTV